LLAAWLAHSSYERALALAPFRFSLAGGDRLHLVAGAAHGRAAAVDGGSHARAPLGLSACFAGGVRLSRTLREAVGVAVGDLADQLDVPRNRFRHGHPRVSSRLVDGDGRRRKGWISECTNRNTDEVCARRDGEEHRGATVGTEAIAPLIAVLAQAHVLAAATRDLYLGAPVNRLN
jgi:hypothetical protein